LVARPTRSNYKLNNYSIILFDGVCNLCNSSVQFVIKHDANNKFKFAALQSEYAKNILAANQIDTEKLSSLVLVENGKIYTESTGALRIAKKLGFPIYLLYAFIIIPPFIRNAVYKYIASNRYKWFGKEETCWIPTAELRNRFIPSSSHEQL
jgi:predicted DCC family thiol-disulfide oxidoreductase YuxK